jgi:hypothetical protein
MYRWHIEERIRPRLDAGLTTDQWKRNLDDYVAAATALWTAMARDGFDSRFPIQVDPNGELIGGAHRLACALSLGIKVVPVEPMHYVAWAPAWGEAWFRAHGMTDIESLRADWEALRQ